MQSRITIKNKRESKNKTTTKTKQGMKINKFFMGMLGALALASCSSEEPVIDNGGNGNGDTNFLTVNLVSTPSNGTRDGGDTHNGDPSGAKYEEGYAAENAVSKIRFYFFDDNGAAAAVKANGKNYVDKDVSASTDKDLPNIEKKINATIVISTPEGDKFPTKIVAVLNPDTEGLGEDNLSLSDLRDRVKDYVAAAQGQNGAFVMINSVYKNGGVEVAATTVNKSNYCDSETEAENHAVNIYVERPVAKVRVKFATAVGYNSETHRIAVKVKDNENSTADNIVYKDFEVEGKKVYLEVTGWNVTAETNMSYISKHIDTNWADNLFGSAVWNWEPYYRSYWAINVDKNKYEDFKQSWHTYNEIGSKGFGEAPENDPLANSIYTNENAPQKAANANSAGADIEDFTKVIMAGKLVYDDGSVVELAKYSGMTLVGEDSMKDALLEQLKNNGMIYSYTTADGKTTYTSLTEDDVEFKVALDCDLPDDVVVGPNETTTGRYLVYLQLSETGKDKNWSKSDKENQTDNDRFASATEVNEYLVKDPGGVQIYKNGLTYYYFPIRHLGDADKIGYYGVVRNHIYDCTINSLYGLGTPVYDPTDVIYPEKPEDNDTFIAAAINILSWRIVPNDIDLKW